MIALRDLNREDSAMLLRWRNLPEISRNMYTDHQIALEEHKSWFGGIFNDPTRHYWVITCDGKDVGLVNLYSIDEFNRRCYWAFYVVPDDFTRGKGIGKAVEFEILCHVFEVLQFNKLCCEVLAFNRGVIRMHERFGFREEGRLRQHIRKSNEFVDVVCLAILRDEWIVKKPELKERLSGNPPAREDK